MQFTTMSVAFFAALASAHQHAPQHFHHRRQLNGTDASTTLTVFATQVYTVTSCAPTVTNCPARNSASAGVVVTEIVALTTTVCPVAEASAVSSSIISSAIATGSGSIVVPTTPASGNSGASVTSAVIIPLSTGVSGPAGSGAETPVSSDTTLTYTIGTGSSTTVITTTIKHTSTATVYATKPAEVTGAAAASSAALTTTIQGTSTSTKYVTVIPASSSAGVGGNSGASGNSGAGGNSGASGAASCAPVTVTETVALSTVTVTATPTGVAGNVAAVTAGNGKGAAESSADEVIVSTATVVPVAVSTGAPFGNGTENATTTKKPCSSIFPSGFISVSKPTGTGAPIAKYKS